MFLLIGLPALSTLPLFVDPAQKIPFCVGHSRQKFVLKNVQMIRYC